MVTVIPSLGCLNLGKELGLGGVILRFFLKLGTSWAGPHFNDVPGDNNWLRCPPLHRVLGIEGHKQGRQIIFRDLCLSSAASPVSIGSVMGPALAWPGLSA